MRTIFLTSALLVSSALLAACAGNHALPSATSFMSPSIVQAPDGLTDKILQAFKGGTDGQFPFGGLLADSGNLYGTTNSGGSTDSFCSRFNGCGIVFELSRAGNGYTEKILRTFTGPPDGAAPGFENLISDSSGALYGTTASGGAGGCYSGEGCGAIFKLTRSGTTYAEHIIYSFKGGDDGTHPSAGLLSDSRGDLFGTTSSGGIGNGGTVYELKRAGKSYSEAVLYSFQYNGVTGSTPGCSLIMDPSGALYGTTSGGGAHAFGSVFKLIPSHDKYVERVLYSFGSKAHDGKSPQAALVFDSNGSLYTTTLTGGASNEGAIIKLSRSGRSYTETVLYSFRGAPDGALPNAPLVLRRGVLYGTTSGGGVRQQGTVFKVSLTGSEKVLYRFAGGSDGSGPLGSVLFNSDGRIFGETVNGGGSGCLGHGCGVAFELQ